MQDDEFEELKKDIGSNGLQMPILLQHGKLVDGRHRLRACKELGITPRFEEITAANDDIARTVVSINLHRRHLTEGQRALIAARIANLGIGGNQYSAEAVSQRQAATDMNVSVDSVQRARKVLKNGAPELVAAVTSGKIDISNAARLAALAKSDQSLLNFDDIKTIQDASKAINKAKFENRRQAIIKGIEAKRANNKPLDTSLGRFSVIYADPPWDYMGEMAVGYPCMKPKEICDMPVKDITTDDAVLFMWCSSSLLEDALAVINAWGFTFKTSAVWDKGSAGQGGYFRQRHEILMLATKGDVPEVPYQSRPESVFSFKRTEHSQKPVQMYDIIDAMYPELAKIELFCRGAPKPGWHGWGNECEVNYEAANSQQLTNII